MVDPVIVPPQIIQPEVNGRASAEREEQRLAEIRRNRETDEQRFARLRQARGETTTPSRTQPRPPQEELIGGRLARKVIDVPIKTPEPDIPITIIDVEPKFQLIPSRKRRVTPKPIILTQPRGISTEPGRIREEVKLGGKIIPEQKSIVELRQEELSKQARKVFPGKEPELVLEKVEVTSRGRAIEQIEVSKLEFERATRTGAKTPEQVIRDIVGGTKAIGSIAIGELAVGGFTIIKGITQPVETVKGFVEFGGEFIVNPQATIVRTLDISRPGALGELGGSLALGELIIRVPGAGISKIKKFREGIKRQQTVTIEGSKGLGDFADPTGFQVLDPKLLELGVDPVLAGKGVVTRGEITFQTQLKPSAFDPISELLLPEQFQPRAVVDPLFRAQIEPTQTMLSPVKRLRVTESGEIFVDVKRPTVTPLEKAVIKEKPSGFQRELEDFGRIKKTPEELALERAKPLNLDELLLVDPSGLTSILLRKPGRMSPMIIEGIPRDTGMLRTPLREPIFTPQKFTSAVGEAVRTGKPLPILNLQPDTDLSINEVIIPISDTTIEPSIDIIPSQAIVPSVSTLQPVELSDISIQQPALAVDLGTESLSETATQQQQAQESFLEQEQVQELKSLIEAPLLIEPLTLGRRLPPPSEFTTLPLLTEDEEKRKKKEDTFSAIIGKPGLETFTITKGLTEQKALKLIKETLGETPAVTGKLIEERTGKKLPAAKFIRRLGEEFRVGKTSAFDIVEKEQFRISSFGEKAGITAKGIVASMRSRKKKKGFF